MSAAVMRVRRAFVPVVTRVVGEQCGSALVLSLAVVAVATLMLATTLSIGVAGTRHAGASNAEQRAAALAEAGVNNAVAVLNANYPGTVAYPGDATLLPARTTHYPDGSSSTWSGTLSGPLSSSPWRWEWRITSTGTVPNPAGTAGSAVTRTAQATVPVVIPTTSPVPAFDILNWIYSGTDTHLSNSVQLATPVYATRDLFLANTATLTGTAHKLVVGRDLYLATNQNRIGLTGGSDPRIDEVHVVHQCSSKATPALHACAWDPDAVYALTHDNSIPPSLAATAQLTCCAPYAGSIAPAGTGGSSSLGFWYANADLGPLSPCDPATISGTPPTFESAGNTAIDDSVTPTTPVNLTPAASYTCKSVAGGPGGGELSWNATTKVLTVKGTILIDGSATISNASTVTYQGAATLVLSGTFDMKSSTACAVASGSSCNTAAWNPNTNLLVIVADGDGGGGGAQGQSGEVGAGEGIHLKGASFQGVLIANKSINIETTSTTQGPMISVYNQVLVAQTGGLSFPTITIAPSGGASVTGIVKPALLAPTNYGG